MGSNKITDKNRLSMRNPELCREWDYKKNGDLKPEDVGQWSNKRVSWVCKKNHEWIDSIAHRSSGRGCPYCSGKRVCNSNCLNTVNPQIAKEWNEIRNGKLSPEDVTLFSNKEIWWKCKKGHEWKASLSHRVRGDGCPYCSGRYSTKQNNLANNVVLMTEWNWSKNKRNPEEYTPKSDEKVWWKCKNGHEWEADIYHRADGTGCPKCNKIELKDGEICDSLLEAYIYLKLTARGIKFIHNKKYSKKNGYRFDFYIPNLKTYIEVTSFDNGSNRLLGNGFWFRYLRKIIKKKLFVEKILGEKFRFIRLTLNSSQIKRVRENMV